MKTLMVVHKMTAWILGGAYLPVEFLNYAGISEVNISKNQLCISAFLQYAQPIINFTPGSRIEVGFVECGRPDDYQNSKIVLRMTQCQISDLVIPQLTNFYPEDEPVIITAIVSGGIEILWDNM